MDQEKLNHLQRMLNLENLKSGDMDRRIINQLEELNSLKEKIKNAIVDPELNWEYRMLLYRKVQLINDRIKEIKSFQYNSKTKRF